MQLLEFFIGQTSELIDSHVVSAPQKAVVPVNVLQVTAKYSFAIDVFLEGIDDAKFALPLSERVSASMADTANRQECSSAG